MFVNMLHLPWLELSIAVALVGSACVSRLRDPNRAFRWSLSFTGLSFSCTLLAWLVFNLGIPDELTRRWSAQPYLFGRRVFGMDELTEGVPGIVEK